MIRKIIAHVQVNTGLGGNTEAVLRLHSINYPDILVTMLRGMHIEVSEREYIAGQLVLHIVSEHMTKMEADLRTIDRVVEVWRDLYSIHTLTRIGV